MTNIDINGSFEGGWSDYNESIQIPAGWLARWADASTPNPYSSDPWNRFVPPEIVHKLRHQLPPDEQDLFIIDGDVTLKAFKGHGAFCLELTYPLTLEPGMYAFTVRIFGDLITLTAGGRKYWAADPNSGLLRFVLNDHDYADTHSITPGLWNVFSLEFAADGDTSFGVQVMCPFALENSGIFADAWSLVKIDGPPDGQCRGKPREQYHRIYYTFPKNARWKDYKTTVRDLFVQRRTMGFSWDDAGIGDLDERIAAMIDAPDKDVAVEWFGEHYPEVEVAFMQVKEDPPPPEPPEPPPHTTTKVGFHNQLPFAGYLDLLDRAVAAGRPVAAVKIVNSNYEEIAAIKQRSPTTLVVGRAVDKDNPDHFINASNFYQALETSNFRYDFYRMVELGFDVIETPLNELIGTNNPDVVEKVVAFEVAYCQWCRDESNGKCAPGVCNPGPGNPQHGYETSLLVPLAEAVILHAGYMMPHTYKPVTPAPGLAESWVLSPQVQYDYHLRPVLSWLPTFEEYGVDVSRLRFIFGEAGACAAHINPERLPGGFIDAGGGWRRADALRGDLTRYVNGVLAPYEKQCQAYPQVVSWHPFTSGRVKWGDFQLNEDEYPVLWDALGL